jgi:hypothetical protein
MDINDVQKEIEKLSRLDNIKHHKNQLKNNKNRALSICSGTCFGGAAEISMRGADGRAIYCQLMPGEVVEFIMQLAAGIGLVVDIKPRKDFASWRAWRTTNEQQELANGHAPLPNLDESDLNVGKGLSTQKNQFQNQGEINETMAA